MTSESLEKFTLAVLFHLTLSFLHCHLLTLLLFCLFWFLLLLHLVTAVRHVLKVFLRIVILHLDSF